MSRRPRPQRAPRKASKHKREIVARKIAEKFNALPPDKKRAFVDETLTALVNMKPKQMKKMFSKFFKKGRPSEKDLELVNQLIVVFLYSVRIEFQFHYATMIYKSLKVPIPADLPEKLKQVRKLVFLGDIGVSPEVYHRLHATWEKMGYPSYDDFFSKLIELNPSTKSDKR